VLSCRGLVLPFSSLVAERRRVRQSMTYSRSSLFSSNSNRYKTADLASEYMERSGLPIGSPQRKDMERDWRSDSVLKQALDYWMTRRGDRTIPRRRDIDPTHVPKLLPHLQLVEPVGGRFRYRLHGTALVEAAGRDQTGAYLDEIFPDERAQIIGSVFHQVCDERRPIFARSRYHTERTVEIVANRLYLPLSEDGQTVSLILGALTFQFASEIATGTWARAKLDPNSQYVERVDGAEAH
jgi:hypothetical protein